LFIKNLKSVFLKKNKTSFNSKIEARLHVSIDSRDDEFSIFCEEDKFTFNLKGGEFSRSDVCDFAVWICLPIAMVKGVDLFVHGVGTAETKRNAERLSDIWSSWLPKKFSLINVEFEKYRELSEPSEFTQRPLMCFSGGVDSTYSLINYDFEGVKPDLLTLQGMDYSVEDTGKFERAINKSSALVDGLVNQRFYVSSNAYDVYRKYKIKTSLSYIFLLATVASYLSKNHSYWILAADHAWYQQFEAFPYASTFATNRYFNQGDYKLVTHGEDVTRSEKLSSIANELQALKSISFCKNKKALQRQLRRSTSQQKGKSSL
jgi:hypothetical protein